MMKLNIYLLPSNLFADPKEMTKHYIIWLKIKFCQFWDWSSSFPFLALIQYKVSFPVQIFLLLQETILINLKSLIQYVQMIPECKSVQIQLQIGIFKKRSLTRAIFHKIWRMFQVGGSRLKLTVPRPFQRAQKSLNLFKNLIS